jgi:hypothetical protein
MMRTFITKIAIIAISIFAIIGIANAEITKNEAEDLVLNQILADDIGKVEIYVSNNIISSQEILYLGNEKTLICPYISNWVFFVDDMVAALWYHPCRYIFVNAETGEYQIINEEIYPENKDSEFELISGLPHHEPVYLPTNPGPPLESAKPNEHLYAVIICGADQTPLWFSTSALYCTLIDVYGYTEDNIIIHYAEGYSTCTEYLDDFSNDEQGDKN